MLTVLCLTGGLLGIYFGISFGVHVYRIKTDSRYRDKLGLLELERQLQDKVKASGGRTDRALR